MPRPKQLHQPSLNMSYASSAGHKANCLSTTRCQLRQRENDACDERMRPDRMPTLVGRDAVSIVQGEILNSNRVTRLSRHDRGEDSCRTIQPSASTRSQSIQGELSL